MNVYSMVDAIGREEGDYIEISNQWCKVKVTRHEGDWVVTEQLAHPRATEDPRATEKRFASLSKAMGYAVHSLGKYRRGSPGQR